MVEVGDEAEEHGGLEYEDGWDLDAQGEEEGDPDKADVDEKEEEEVRPEKGGEGKHYCLEKTKMRKRQTQSLMRAKK